MEIQQKHALILKFQQLISKHVYFTLDSIKGITEIKKFEPQINNYIGYLNGYRVNCCWMDENTATYSSEYVCEIDDEKEGPFNFIGYDINQYIACQLNPICFFR